MQNCLDIYMYLIICVVCFVLSWREWYLLELQSQYVLLFLKGFEFESSTSCHGLILMA
jgi:hypothetical protein